MSDYIRTFNRFELKYILHYEQARELVKMMRAHVRWDKNRGRHDGFYKISSLYWDSPDLMCYWEKMDGEKYRRKVRVRTYGEQAEAAFAEIKQRYNLSVQKRRTRGTVEDVQATMNSILAGRYDGGDPVFDEIFNLVKKHSLEPKVVVSYTRAAFFDLYKNDLRITLDRNIRCRNISLDLTQDRMRGVFALSPTMMVLEVKCNESMPRWLCTCLNTLDLQIHRFSKYCHAIDALGMTRIAKDRPVLAM